ncbi:hypothetical protein N9571_01345 [Yoonia sp.]|nr:hypothetical protein [Yoonia sp.]
MKALVAKHRRFKLHFTPTSAFSMNLVEHFFAEITAKRIRRVCYSSVYDLEEAIYSYLLQHNALPKPFRLEEDCHRHPIPPAPRTRPDQVKLVANDRLATIRRLK